MSSVFPGGGALLAAGKKDSFRLHTSSGKLPLPFVFAELVKCVWMCTETGLCQRCIKVIKIKIESSVITSGTWVGPGWGLWTLWMEWIDLLRAMRLLPEFRHHQRSRPGQGTLTLGRAEWWWWSYVQGAVPTSTVASNLNFHRNFPIIEKKSVSISWNQITRIFSWCLTKTEDPHKLRN